MRELIHTPHCNLGLPPSYAEQAHLRARECVSRGKLLLNLPIGSFTWFSRLTPERSSFRENPTYISPYIYPPLNNYVVLFVERFMAREGNLGADSQ